MWIFLFPVVVISMLLLVMYEKDRHTLKKFMARGRCGLPGMPNKNFFQLDEGIKCDGEEEEPFEKDVNVLHTSIIDQRKKIEETRERVVIADKQLQSLSSSATGMKRKYDMVMYMLKENLLDIEEEHRLLDHKLASAGELREKFYSLDNECEDRKSQRNAASCAKKPPSEQTENCLPVLPKQNNLRRSSGCCVRPASTSVQQPQSSSSDPCNQSPRPPCCPSPAPPPPPPPCCHPPVKRPPRSDGCERPGVPFCCKYPGASDYGFPPQMCSSSRPKGCCPSKYLSRRSPSASCCSNSNALAVKKTSGVPRNSNPSKPSNNETRNSSCCSTNEYSSRKNSNGMNPNQRTMNSSCCSPSRNNSNDISPTRRTRNSSFSSTEDYSPRNNPNGINPNQYTTRSSCCSTDDNQSPPRNNSIDNHQRSPSLVNGSAARRSRSSSSEAACCSTEAKPDPCAPPTFCPGRCACPCCKCEPPAPKCPPSQLIRKPPFSSFFQERMPVQPLRTVKQTVYSERIENGDRENVAYDTQVITEVRTSSVTFPPKCCMSVYEDFMRNNPPEPPNVKLPVIVDPCDPCAEIPRVISPYEDVVNISHTCGTQTNGEEENRKSTEEKRPSVTFRYSQPCKSKKMI